MAEKIGGIRTGVEKAWWGKDLGGKGPGWKRPGWQRPRREMTQGEKDKGKKYHGGENWGGKYRSRALNIKTKEHQEHVKLYSHMWHQLKASYELSLNHLKRMRLTTRVCLANGYMKKLKI